MSVLCRDYVGIVSDRMSVLCRYCVGILSESMSDCPAILFAPLCTPRGVRTIIILSSYFFDLGLATIKGVARLAGPDIRIK